MRGTTSERIYLSVLKIVLAAKRVLWVQARQTPSNVKSISIIGQAVPYGSECGSKRYFGSTMGIII